MPDSTKILTDHLISGYSRSLQLTVASMSRFEHGMIPSAYEISGFDTTNNPARDVFKEYATMRLRLVFEVGSRLDGPNGISTESLLAIVIDRLASSAPMRLVDIHDTDAHALAHAQEALMWLKRRAENKIIRQE